MVKGNDQLTRGRIPKLGGFVSACCQDPSTVRTELRLKDLVLMGKGGDQLAQGRIQELGAVIRADRQDPSAIRAKVKTRPVCLQKPLPDRTMVTGFDQLARCRIPEAGHFIPRRQHASPARLNLPPPATPTPMDPQPHPTITYLPIS